MIPPLLLTVKCIRTQCTQLRSTTMTLCCRAEKKEKISQIDSKMFTNKLIVVVVISSSVPVGFFLLKRPWIPREMFWIIKIRAAKSITPRATVYIIVVLAFRQNFEIATKDLRRGARRARKRECIRRTKDKRSAGHVKKPPFFPGTRRTPIKPL